MKSASPGSARYDKDFTPAQRFEPDADTLALYHCDEGIGDILKDSSGNGHHGKIVGAKWVKADGTAIASDEGWVQLFNGKDLQGWKTHPKNTGHGKVKDGVIVGSGPQSHLFSERGDYENFHFRVEAKINDKGNSGQYFRTAFGQGFPKGYEAQINSTHGDPVQDRQPLHIVKITEQLAQAGRVVHPGSDRGGQPHHHQGQRQDDRRLTTRRTPTRRAISPCSSTIRGTVVKFRKIEVKELPQGAIDDSQLKKTTPEEIAAKKQQEEWAAKLKLPVEATNKIGMKMILIPPAGAALPKAYYLGKYEVTQGEWEKVMGYNPSGFGPKNAEGGGDGHEQIPGGDGELV